MTFAPRNAHSTQPLPLEGSGDPAKKAFSGPCYYPFGMMMPHPQNVDVGGHTFGFNSMESDDEMKGNQNSYNFGARIYDPRVGRWLSIDPKAQKYPSLSPYHFAANNPTNFVDYEGEDFGLKIDHENKTITVVANIYTVSKKTRKQAEKAAAQWNSVKGSYQGYDVTFNLKVVGPDDIDMTISAGSQTSNRNWLKATLATTADPIGNYYGGLTNIKGEKNKNNVFGDQYVGGEATNGRYVVMNDHKNYGDLSRFSDLVAHEFGHLLGLDDPLNPDKNQGGPYHPRGGIMEYTSSGRYLKDIKSQTAIGNVLDFAFDMGGVNDKRLSNVVEMGGTMDEVFEMSDIEEGMKDLEESFEEIESELN